MKIEKVSKKQKRGLLIVGGLIAVYLVYRYIKTHPQSPPVQQLSQLIPTPTAGANSSAPTDSLSGTQSGGVPPSLSTLTGAITAAITSPTATGSTTTAASSSATTSASTPAPAPSPDPSGTGGSGIQPIFPAQQPTGTQSAPQQGPWGSSYTYPIITPAAPAAASAAARQAAADWIAPSAYQQASPTTMEIPYSSDPYSIWLSQNPQAQVQTGTYVTGAPDANPAPTGMQIPYDTSNPYSIWLSQNPQAQAQTSTYVTGAPK